MLWELLLSILCLSIGFGVAFTMVYKIKNPPSSPSNTEKDNTDSIAKAVKESLESILGNLSLGQLRQNKKSDTDIEIDEALIPTTVSLENIESNVKNMSKVEETEDKDLKTAKSKLAKLKKKKDK